MKKQDPNQAVISMLEHLIEEVKAGKIRDVSYSSDIKQVWFNYSPMPKIIGADCKLTYRIDYLAKEKK